MGRYFEDAMEKQNGSTLVKKLAKIMAETRWVEKKGRNSFFNYDYARETDILDAVRAKLAENGVFVFTSVESVDLRETGKRTRDGSPVNMVTVRTKHVFRDAETGESAEVFGTGSGEDAGDKAVYKAITGAMKYFISKNFLISTGDDPEKDSETEKGNFTRESPAPVQAQEPRLREDFSPDHETTSMSPVGGFESPTLSPSPAFTRAQGSAERTLNENPVKDVVIDIQSKTGPKRDGSLYTRHSIQTRDHGYFTTFNAAFADLAQDAMHSGQEVLIRYKMNGRWKDILSIRYVEAGAPQEANAIADADNLPF
jgi:hypothetical protein